MESRKAFTFLLVAALATLSPLGFWPYAPECACACSINVGCPMCKGHFHPSPDPTAGRCECALQPTEGGREDDGERVTPPAPALLPHRRVELSWSPVPADPRTRRHGLERAVKPPRPRPRASA